MAKATTNTKIAQQLSVTQPEEEQGMAVSHLQWSIYMKRIEGCGEPPNKVEGFAWFALGIGVSTLLSGIAYASSVDYLGKGVDGGPHLRVIVLVATIVFFGVGLAGIGSAWVSFYHASIQRHSQQTLREYVLEDMRTHAERFKILPPVALPIIQSSTVSPAPTLVAASASIATTTVQQPTTTSPIATSSTTTQP